jgi:YD repeat-containing protein
VIGGHRSGVPVVRGRVPNLHTNRSTLMRTQLGLGLGFVMLAAACSSQAPSDNKLPGASITPQPQTDTQDESCGDIVEFGSDTTPDLTYTNTFDATTGEQTGAVGVYAWGGSNDNIAYSWDAHGNWTGMTESNAPGDVQETVSVSYDANQDLIDYATSWTDGSDGDAWDYALSQFIAVNEAAVEVVSEVGGTAVSYALAYDSDGRLVSAIPNVGDAITYTYDDAARTLAVSSGDGAYTGLITYDADNNELSEVWGGTGSGVYASSSVYTWNGDDLLTATYAYGTAAAPSTASVYETDTLEYNCPAVRRASGGGRIAKPSRALRAAMPRR